MRPELDHIHVPKHLFSFTAAGGDPWPFYVSIQFTEHILVHYSTPSSQQSNKKLTLLAPFFSQRNWRLSKLKWFFSRPSDSKERHNLNSIFGTFSTSPQMLFTPLIPNRKEFPISPLYPPAPRLPFRHTLSPPKLQKLRQQATAKLPDACWSSDHTEKALGRPFSIRDQWDRSQDKPCWRWADLGRERARTVYTFACMLSTEDEIILHRAHFCAVKAYGCFASKTVDLSFASDIPQSAYNSVLAYQPSNLPL